MRPLLLKGHERPLTQVKFNREGDLLFTTAKDKRPTVWRADTGERLGTYNGHNGAVWGADMTYDSSRLLTGSADNSAMLWDTASGKRLHQWTHKSPVRAIAFSPGDSIVTAATAKLMGQQAQIYFYRHAADMASVDPEPVMVLGGLEATATRVLWHPTSTFLITVGEDAAVKKWDAETGTLLETVRLHKKGINDAQWSSTGEQFVTASSDCTAKVWDTRSLEVLKTFTVEAPVNSASMSPTFDHVLLGGGQEASQVTTTGNREGKFEARLFHTIYESEFGRVRGHFGPINTVAFTPDGKGYVSGGEDGFVRLHYFDQSYFDRDYD